MWAHLNIESPFQQPLTKCSFLHEAMHPYPWSKHLHLSGVKVPMIYINISYHTAATRSSVHPLTPPTTYYSINQSINAVTRYLFGQLIPAVIHYSFSHPFLNQSIDSCSHLLFNQPIEFYNRLSSCGVAPHQTMVTYTHESRYCGTYPSRAYDIRAAISGDTWRKVRFGNRIVKEELDTQRPWVPLGGMTYIALSLTKLNVPATSEMHNSRQCRNCRVTTESHAVVLFLTTTTPIWAPS